MASLVRLTSNVSLAPESASFIRVKRARNTSHENGFYLCSAIETGVIREGPSLVIVDSINYVEKGKSFGVKVVNMTGRWFEIKKCNVIARIEKLDKADEFSPLPQKSR